MAAASPLPLKQHGAVEQLPDEGSEADDTSADTAL